MELMTPPEPQQPKQPDQEIVPVALYGHCESTYNALIANAKTVLTEDNETTIVVWEGMLVNLITGKLHLSVPYYTSITKALKRMGCIRQLRRGGGTSPSQWEVIKAPTIEAFLLDQPIKIVEQSRYALLQTQFTALNARVATLEGIFKKFFEDEMAVQVKLDNSIPPTPPKIEPSELGDLNG